MKTTSYLPKLLCLALALAWTQGAQASTVFWGSTFQDNLFDSAGNALDPTYSFEIGTFGAFTPTYQNVDQWQANWHVIDRAFDPDSNGWNSTDQFFAGTVGFNPDGTSDSPDANPVDAFTQGDVVYLWVYNSKSIVPGSEWALVTDGTTVGNSGDPWIIPDPSDTLGSYNWNLGDASTPVVGGANNVQGAGTYTATPGVFSLQTAVVPEPGSVMLLLAAAAAHLTRRARRLTRMSQF
ncbi:PEP-CTERM sorting domain-containing protein [Prosthecobacter sp.]|uniref:PEP-CTERM sorting domain-containing protein n=1 Tax=Prosthecobacter sp. TaxID=1965333 RepID=UPI0037844487